MPLGGPGPRDWSPPEFTNDAPTMWQRGFESRRPVPPTTMSSRRSTHPWGYAALSMLLGLGSLVLALLEPQRSGIASGFIASSIGITAIVLGVRAMRVGRWRSTTSRAFGRGGVILGAVGSALMAYAVVATALLAMGIALPALSLAPGGVGTQSILRGMPLPAAPNAPDPTASSGSSDEGQVSGADEEEDVLRTPDWAAAAPDDSTDGAGDPPAADAPAPPAAVLPSDPVSGLPAVVDHESEANALAASAGTLAIRFRHSFAPGMLPSTLIVGMSAPERVLLPDGTPLAPVPDGTRVLYQVSDDGTQWSVTLIGSRYGAVATFSSAIGYVQKD